MATSTSQENPGRRCEEELVQGSATTKGQATRQLGNPVQLDDGTADDEILLDLRVEQPGSLRAPGRDVVPRDHASGSTSTLTMSFQPGRRTAPAVLAARRNGV